MPFVKGPRLYMVKVELVYVAKDKTIIHQTLQLNAGATVEVALKESGIYSSHPETTSMPVGIFAKRAPLDTVLKDGDRIEIYRSLEFDPKENRRQRAKIKK